MFGLQEIRKVNREAQAKADGIVANSNHSAKLKTLRDAKVEKAAKATRK